MAGARCKKGIRRSFKLLKLKQAAAKIGSIQRAGPLATALWGSGVSGLSGRQLQHLRRAAATSLHVDKKGTSVGLKLATTKIGRVMDPFCFYHSQ
eukprot:7664738-Pyramimonas_sp.AAC.1